MLIYIKIGRNNSLCSAEYFKGLIHFTQSPWQCKEPKANDNEARHVFRVIFKKNIDKRNIKKDQ